MLKEDKFLELSGSMPELALYYEKLDNGFYRYRSLEKEEEKRVKAVFGEIGFSALNFTDSRSIFQFYPLNRLWKDICTALEAGLRL